MTNEFKPVIDWLTYRSYEHNRKNNPHIPYYKWRKIYSDAVDFEDIYERYIGNTSNICDKYISNIATICDEYERSI